MKYNDQPAPKRNAVKILLLAGLLVGSLDILAAFTDYYINTGKGPEGVLRYIASGVFDKTAFSGSSTMILWGLLFHYIIAVSFTILFYLLYSKTKFLPGNPFLSAFFYGIFIWAVMRFIVLPLSNVPLAGLEISKVIKAILILVFMIGLPLSLIMKKYFSNTITAEKS